ncbi:hypothetical protein Ndes2437B_g06707 [Nannochloris sp. 'desiccata']|nr:hypothetical protein KSW81_003985 [Chlorella desiccata (nom. nud.)]
MGRLFVEYLPEGRKYACKECLAGCSVGHSVVHLAAVSDLLSKSFHSRQGPAYLFTNAVNVTLGSPEERDMTTGKHIVRDLYCIACGTNLGWRYELAHEEREKYKEGKYILERLQLVDLEAATNGYNTTTTRLLGPPLSSSAAVTTATVLGGAGAGASPTGVMAIMMMPENGSPLSSSGERTPSNMIGGVLVPPPPPPPPTRLLNATGGNGLGLIRRSIVSAGEGERRNEEERDEEMYSQPDSLNDAAAMEIPDLRALFSSWGPTTATTALAGAGGGVAVGDAVVGVPAAITDPPPPHFNIDL